jgi:hypothetical protein
MVHRGIQLIISSRGVISASSILYTKREVDKNGKTVGAIQGSSDFEDEWGVKIKNYR